MKKVYVIYERSESVAGILKVSAVTGLLLICVIWSGRWLGGEAWNYLVFSFLAVWGFAILLRENISRIKVTLSDDSK